MPQDKLEQRAWKFVATDKSRIPVTSLQTSIEWCREQLRLAAEIVARCPDIRVAVSEIRKLME